MLVELHGKKLLKGKTLPFLMSLIRKQVLYF